MTHIIHPHFSFFTRFKLQSKRPTTETIPTTFSFAYDYVIVRVINCDVLININIYRYDEGDWGVKNYSNPGMGLRKRGKSIPKNESKEIEWVVGYYIIIRGKGLVGDQHNPMN
jgi:hypothetical protein